MVLDRFHPAVARWFGDRFSSPTECQLRAWPAIRARTHTLIAAPTGSGKTLAAFLCAIDDLLRQGLEQGYLDDATQVLYISPLKALSNDVQKNLQEPLCGIRDQLLAHGQPDVDIRAWVRTGDTPPGERERMRRNPPHILVTTPESLYIMLTAASGRAMLASVRTVIVDEIHALVGNKRGAHLALSLERLAGLANQPFARIGLSATQRPVGEIASFLIGNDREPRIVVDVGHSRKRDLAVEVTDIPLDAVMSTEAWQLLYDRLATLIEQHGTTLVFVNTRRLAERAARHLGERLGEEAVTAHHGSLAREHRLEAERRLKGGDLKALVATASLELGIDIGQIDLVCQIGSPRLIATFLQRVGRSGHTLDAVPKGRVFPTSLDDLVECVALLDAVRSNELESLTVARQPLDVLAQQVVAEVAAADWEQDALLEMSRRAWPYRSLAREDFEQIVTMVAEGFSTRRGRRSALLHQDLVNRRLRQRRGSRLIAVTNGGTIPDQFDYDVILEPQGQFIGTLNEDFAFESLPGDIFQLGNTSYRVLRVERSTVRVEDAAGQPPNIPFWFGEAPGRSDELSRAVSRLRGEFAARWAGDRAGIDEWLGGLGIDPSVTRQLVDYLGAAHDALGVLPTFDTVVFERFFDEAGDTHLVIHAPYGSRVNRAWGLALRKRFCRRFNFELQAAALEDSIVLSLSATHSFPLEEVREYLHAENVRGVLIQALLDVPMFATHWRWNATTALAVRRNRNGQRVPPQIQRMDAEDLVAVVFPDQLACLENIAGEREIPDHPLVRQTIDDCLRGVMDIDGLERVLRDIHAGSIRVVTRDLPMPSPLAREILAARPYAFLDDAPAEERRTNAVQARRWVEPESAADLARLDPAVVGQVRDEAWPDPRSPDELHDALLTLGCITAEEAVRGLRSGAAAAPAGWRGLFDELVNQRRATCLRLPEGYRVWVAAERLAEWMLLHPQARLEPPIPPVCAGAGPADAEQAAKEIVRSRLQGLGPVAAATLARTSGIPLPRVEGALAALEVEGFAIRGCFVGDGEEWCDRVLLARIHRRTIKRLRREIEPVNAADFVRFLTDWQGVSQRTRGAGERFLERVIDQMEGFEAAVAAWESILGARVDDYQPEWLDRLCLTGRVRWQRLSTRDPAVSTPVRATPLALLPRQHANLWRQAVPAAATDRLAEPARGVYHALSERGALFLDELSAVTMFDVRTIESALRELVAAALVSADGFGALRGLAARRNRSLDTNLDNAGRWYRIDATVGGEPGWTTDRLGHAAHALLRRYGVICHTILRREPAFMPPWRDLLPVLRRLEARGEIRGGRFVAGISGEQFALPEAVALLRETRRRPRDGESVAICAADPLNFTGIIVPGARIPAAADTRMVYRDGVPIAVARGGQISFLGGLDEAEQWAARAALQGEVNAPAPGPH